MIIDLHCLSCFLRFKCASENLVLSCVKEPSEATKERGIEISAMLFLASFYELVPIWIDTDRVTSCNNEKKMFALVRATFIRLKSLKNPIPLLPAALTHEKMTICLSTALDLETNQMCSLRLNGDNHSLLVLTLVV
jgi:hypothetical protein